MTGPDPDRASGPTESVDPDSPILPGHGALVHEWIEPFGGSEKVLDVLAGLLPAADLVCLWNDVPDRFPNHRIRESLLARTPLRKHKSLAMLAATAVWRYRANDHFDLAVISSHQFAQQQRFRRQSSTFRKYVYVHSPARYLWAPELDTRGSGLLPRIASPVLRRIDRQRAAESTLVAANSNFVRERIRRSWGLDASVVYPPVDIARIQAVLNWADVLDSTEAAAFEKLPASFLLGASRLTPYKRLDLVIEAGVQAGLPVVIAGSGPDLSRLQEIAAAASVPVIFLGKVSDPLLFALYQRAQAYIFPAVEDFGLMPVEAMAAGAAIVANSVGGTGESVTDGVSGALCDFSSGSGVVEAISKASTLSPLTVAAASHQFSTESFRSGVRQWLSAR